MMPCLLNGLLKLQVIFPTLEGTDLDIADARKSAMERYFA
jgi:hypothetical protein